MKHVFALAVAALSGIANLPAHAADTLSIRDVTAAARRSETDKHALEKLRGRTIALSLSRRPNTPYFDAVGDPGIVVLCPLGSRFDGGIIITKVKSFELNADSGSEYVNVLTLDSCKKEG